MRDLRSFFLQLPDELTNVFGTLDLTPEILFELKNEVIDKNVIRRSPMKTKVTDDEIKTYLKKAASIYYDVEDLAYKLHQTAKKKGKKTNAR